MSSNILSDRDVNVAMAAQEPAGKPDIKSMEYHRQVLQSKMEDAKYAQDLPAQAQVFFPPNAASDARTQQQQYISPSDNIMSPCTAKLNAPRNKQVGKYVVSPLLPGPRSREIRALTIPPRP